MGEQLPGMDNLVRTAVSMTFDVLEKFPLMTGDDWYALYCNGWHWTEVRIVEAYLPACPDEELT